nr:MAG TPA: hypothetical protein [Caudoviricetes sp.]
MRRGLSKSTSMRRSSARRGLHISRSARRWD